MQVLKRSLLSQLVGGTAILNGDDDGGEQSAGGGGGGGGGGGSSGGSGAGAGTIAPTASTYDIYAVGVENGAPAVVRITGTSAVFTNDPVVELHGPGEAPWAGQYLGQWVEPEPPSYAHTAFDGALIANTGRLAGTAAAAFIEGALTGAGVGAAGAGVGAIAGIVIGGFVGVGVYYLLQHDHETGHFVSAPTGGGNVPQAAQ